LTDRVQVQTNKGLIARDELEVVDEVHETADTRVIQTIWKHAASGEEVRRDVTISILRGLDLEKTQGV
jgi:uncharacterized protein YbcV (DUF1398 family)